MSTEKTKQEPLYERFIRNLCVTGVVFAVLYAVFPEITAKMFTDYGPYFGPIIVILLFFIAWKKRTKA